MRIGEKSTYYPRLSIGIKKMLLKLNLDLDTIKEDVVLNRDYGFFFDHSILPSDSVLTKLEILVLFLEDRRFFLHRGFEARSLLRVARRFLRSGRLGGMSTIDQQAVRISSKRHERSISRKVREILLAYLCNFHLSKKEILDYYLHNAYMGYRIEGCEIASQKLFGVSAADLSWDQAALIASLYPLPLPKSVWEIYSSDLRYPDLNPKYLLDLASSVAPRWSSRIHFRMAHALKHQDFKPRSL